VSVEPVIGTILDRDVLPRLRRVDLIFGCVDKAWPRSLLCDFSSRYLRPYIDVGSEIGGDEKGIMSLDTRCSYVAPGRPCLECTGVVTGRQLKYESLTYAETRKGAFPRLLRRLGNGQAGCYGPQHASGEPRDALSAALAPALLVDAVAHRNYREQCYVLPLGTQHCTGTKRSLPTVSGQSIRRIWRLFTTTRDRTAASSGDSWTGVP